MDFTLTDQQRAVRDRARAFARDVLAPTVDDKDHRQEFPVEELRAAAEAGLTGLAVPERFGGTPIPVGMPCATSVLARVLL